MYYEIVHVRHRCPKSHLIEQEVKARWYPTVVLVICDQCMEASVSSDGMSVEVKQMALPIKMWRTKEGVTELRAGNVWEDRDDNEG